MQFLDDLSTQQQKNCSERAHKLMAVLHNPVQWMPLDSWRSLPHLAAIAGRADVLAWLLDREAVDEPLPPLDKEFGGCTAARILAGVSAKIISLLLYCCAAVFFMLLLAQPLPLITWGCG